MFAAYRSNFRRKKERIPVYATVCKAFSPCRGNRVIFVHIPRARDKRCQSGNRQVGRTSSRPSSVFFGWIAIMIRWRYRRLLEIASNVQEERCPYNRLGQNENMRGREYFKKYKSIIRLLEHCKSFLPVFLQTVPLARRSAHEQGSTVN